MIAIKSANLALRFILELCALVAIGYWGFQTGQNTLIKVLLGIGMPFVTAVIWGIFVSPKAKNRLPEIGRLVVEILVFGGGVLSLFTTGQSTLATIFAVLVLLHLPLTFLFKQRHR